MAVDDPFSFLLGLDEAEPILAGRLLAGSGWALRFQAPKILKFFAIAKGGCWLRDEHGRAPLRLGTGDFFLYSEPRSFVLCDDLKHPPIAASSLEVGDDQTIRIGPGDVFTLIGGHVNQDPLRGSSLTELLPPFIHVRGDSSQAGVILWLLEQLLQEDTSEAPGSRIASARLAQLLLVHVLRCRLLSTDPLPAGLFRASGDSRIAPALRLMHAEPDHDWKLEELARTCAMSRTAFAIYFKSVAGITPLAYLTTWRMQLARKALRDGKTSVISLATSLGYTSESAFSNAFKRLTGLAPKRFQKQILKEAIPDYEDAVA